MSEFIKYTYRKALISDYSALEKLIINASKKINNSYYSDKEIDAAIGTVWTVDEQLIKDKTYWVVENPEGKIVGCGGWSKRKVFYGKQEALVVDNDESVPGVDAAKIRAFFVDPQHIRNGIGRKLLDLCENEAKIGGYKSLELLATLSGEQLYKAKGYYVIKREQIETEKGIFSEGVSMFKSL